MKWLIDMNLSPRWVETLAAAGIDATHWTSLGLRDAADTEIMAFARAYDYGVITHDLDFSAILAATQGVKPSVVQIRADDIRPSVLGPAVIAALRQMADELAAGALLTIDPRRARLRLLPLSGANETR